MFIFEFIIFLSFETTLHIMCRLIILVYAYRSVSVWKKENERLSPHMVFGLSETCGQ